MAKWFLPRYDDNGSTPGTVNDSYRTDMLLLQSCTFGCTFGGWGLGGWVLLGPMGRWSPKGHFGPLAQITEAAAVAFPGKQLGHFATLPITEERPKAACARRNTPRAPSASTC